jgi:hypothetical protein
MKGRRGTFADWGLVGDMVARRPSRSSRISRRSGRKAASRGSRHRYRPGSDALVPRAGIVLLTLVVALAFVSFQDIGPQYIAGL